MKSYTCSNCGFSFLVRRDFCPECRSKVITEGNILGGTVIYSVKLTATPEPFPDQYYLLLVTDGNIRFFCRSEENIPEGGKVKLTESESGPCCESV